VKILQQEMELNNQEYLQEKQKQNEINSVEIKKQSAEKDCLRELSATEIISVSGGKFECTAGGGKVVCTW
jgi:hypothetical protein